MAGRSVSASGLGRIVRVAALGLVVGAVVGFVGALLRPRRWIEADLSRASLEPR